MPGHWPLLQKCNDNCLWGEPTKFYFGQDGTLVERQRTGTVDNTGVFNEKLPNFFISADAADPFAP